MFRKPRHRHIHTWVERAGPLLAKGQDVTSRVALANSLVFYCVLFGDSARNGIHCEHDQAPSPSGGRPPLARIMWQGIESAFAHWVETSNERSLEAVGEGLVISERAGVHLLDFLLHAQGAHGAFAADDARSAEAHLEKMSSVMGSRRQMLMANYLYLRAWFALQQGELHRSVSYAREGAELASRAGVPIPEVTTRSGMAHALLELGDTKGRARNR